MATCFDPAGSTGLYVNQVMLQDCVHLWDHIDVYKRHTHTCTHMRPHTHTHTHACTHVRAHTHVRMRAHTHTHIMVCV